ncbi:MAG: GatB/YqeY domain-containing protein [Acidobacteriaceae bacterium]|nr:GatB/YqeY domain-containing protein [Acidobacteriaceae bacterium]
MAAIGTTIDRDIITAMKAKEADKLTTLRLVKSALKSREIDKREPLTDAEEQSMLTTMLKQRRESIDQFTKGGRPELAAKEQVEIELIEAYMPKAAGAEELLPIVQGAIAKVVADNGGASPSPKDMGTVMKIAQQRLLADGVRADGKLLSELVKTELAKA